jgi:hypothetical protein
MKPEQRKKEVKYRLDAMWSSDAIASEFFLNTDDNVLINRISNGDESALLQFGIKHINILKRGVVKSNCRGIEKEIMNIYLPLFFDKIKTFAKVHANKPLPESWEHSGKYIKGLQMDFAMAEPLIDEKYKIWKDYKITDKHIDFLNELNAFLIKTEERIVERAKADISMLEKQAKENGSSTSDYEYFVDIGYSTEASDGDPIYTASHSFYIENIKRNEWGLLCDGEDWRERGWLPALNTRCCYLMHELVYDAGLAHFIFDIKDIHIETKIWDQNFVSIKTGVWETVKWDKEG